MNFVNKQTYKAVAIALAWISWIVPFGFHRMMMRRKFWWIHPVAFLIATAACIIFFFDTPENVEFGRLYVEYGTLITISDFVGGWERQWLIGFAGLWMLLVVYDAIVIFTWHLPEEKSKDKK